MASISISATPLKLDQTAGVQDSDFAIGTTLAALADRFEKFLLGTALAPAPNIPGTLALDSAQLAFAASAEAAKTSLTYVTVTPDAGTVDDLFFSDGDGALFDGDQVFWDHDNDTNSAAVALKTIGGDDIFLHSYDGGDIVLATTSATSGAGEVVAGFYLNEAQTHLTAGVEMVTFMSLAHPDAANPDESVNWSDLLNVTATESINFNFDLLDPGSYLWATVGTNQAAVLVTGLNLSVDSAGKKLNASDDVHASNGGDGTTVGLNNQLFDVANETGVFTLVKGLQTLGTTQDGIGGDYVVDFDGEPDGPKGNKNEGINYSDYLNVGSASIYLSQSQGSPDTPKSLDIKVLEAGDGENPEQGAGYIPGLASDTAVNVATVTVLDDSGVEVGTWVAPGTTPASGQVASGTIVEDVDNQRGVLTDVKVTISGNTIDVDGLLGEFTVRWTVPEGETFNRFHVIQEAGQFDIGRVLIDEGVETSEPIGQQLLVDDDFPTVPVPFDADPVASGVQTPEKLGNAVNQTASGKFGYDIGADTHTAAFYQAGGSDFVDVNNSLAGVQLTLTGTVENAQNPNITNAVATLSSETASTATFAFSFHYDKDPLTAGVQDATAGGTLVFNKAADTYAFTLTDAIDGFSTTVLHTSELLSKQPTSNTGHPQIVLSRLAADDANTPADEDFYVQFTANATPLSLTANGQGSSSDTSYTAGSDHQLASSDVVTWVSATQATNGVAGDTIQKGELLTLRFFNSDVGIATEATDPTALAAGVAIKFDGIGASEDLVLILDLKDAGGNEITRAITANNSDIFKTGQVPAAYSSEFSLDQNDGLLIIEANDFNLAGETYQIQGIQIMQSANGLTGQAINLVGAVGAGGGSTISNGTAFNFQSFTDASFGNEQDVLKITDIGFLQINAGTLDADLDFAFQIADADLDTTAVQHLLVNISNDWIV